MQIVRSSAAVVGLALLASGCFIDTDDDDAIIIPSTGVATIDWTVNQTKDPNACRALFADRIEITILSEDGRVVIATYAQVCEAFATSITLNVGSYAADALLVDAGGNPRTTTIQITPFRIFGGDNVSIPIDFPADSFF